MNNSGNFFRSFAIKGNNNDYMMMAMCSEERKLHRKTERGGNQGEGIAEAISLNRKDETVFRAQVESLALYKSTNGSFTFKKREGIIYGQIQIDRYMWGWEHVEIIFCGFNFVSKIQSKSSSAENKFWEGGVDLKKMRGV